MIIYKKKIKKKNIENITNGCIREKLRGLKKLFYNEKKKLNIIKVLVDYVKYFRDNEC